MEWLDSTELTASPQFDYQGEKTRSSYSYQATTNNSRFDYSLHSLIIKGRKQDLVTVINPQIAMGLIMRLIVVAMIAT